MGQGRINKLLSQRYVIDWKMEVLIEQEMQTKSEKLIDHQYFQREIKRRARESISNLLKFQNQIKGRLTDNDSPVDFEQHWKMVQKLIVFYQKAVLNMCCGFEQTHISDCGFFVAKVYYQMLSVVGMLLKRIQQDTAGPKRQSIQDEKKPEPVKQKNYKSEMYAQLQRNNFILNNLEKYIQSEATTSKMIGVATQNESDMCSDKDITDITKLEKITYSCASSLLSESLKILQSHQYTKDYCKNSYDQISAEKWFMEYLQGFNNLSNLSAQQMQFRKNTITKKLSQLFLQLRNIRQSQQPSMKRLTANGSSQTDYLDYIFADKLFPRREGLTRDWQGELKDSKVMMGILKQDIANLQNKLKKKNTQIDYLNAEKKIMAHEIHILIQSLETIKHKPTVGKTDQGTCTLPQTAHSPQNSPDSNTPEPQRKRKISRRATIQQNKFGLLSRRNKTRRQKVQFTAYEDEEQEDVKQTIVATCSKASIASHVSEQGTVTQLQKKLTLNSGVYTGSICPIIKLLSQHQVVELKIQGIEELITKGNQLQDQSTQTYPPVVGGSTIICQNKLQVGAESNIGSKPTKRASKIYHGEIKHPLIYQFNENDSVPLSIDNKKNILHKRLTKIGRALKSSRGQHLGNPFQSEVCGSLKDLIYNAFGDKDTVGIKNMRTKTAARSYRKTEGVIRTQICTVNKEPQNACMQRICVSEKDYELFGGKEAAKAIEDIQIGQLSGRVKKPLRCLNSPAKGSNKQFFLNYSVENTSKSSGTTDLKEIFSHINRLKSQNLHNYLVIRNLLKYPHSYLQNSSDPIWKSKQGDTEISEGDFYKIFSRILKVHSNCTKEAGERCEHIERFLEKIGYKLVVSEFI